LFGNQSSLVVLIASPRRSRMAHEPDCS
jgi:hypothetical protein